MKNKSNVDIFIFVLMATACFLLLAGQCSGQTIDPSKGYRTIKEILPSSIYFRNEADTKIRAQQNLIDSLEKKINWFKEYFYLSSEIIFEIDINTYKPTRIDRYNQACKNYFKKYLQ